MKDQDGHDFTCYCEDCQDNFLSRECQPNDFGAESLAPSSSAGVPNSTTISSKNHAINTPPSSEDQTGYSPTRKLHKTTRIARVNKPVANTRKDRPEVLLKQLQEALSADADYPADVKRKAVLHFQGLKDLLSKSTSQPANIASHHQSRQRNARQRQATQEQQAEKTFSCTSPGCKFSPTNSAMDWRRHEETHWPQKRYMCTQCPVILVDPTSDSYIPHCQFCMMEMN